MNIWNYTEDESLASVLPTDVRYVAGVDEEGHAILSDTLPFEHITGDAFGTTLHGVKVSGLPVGVAVRFMAIAGGNVIGSLDFGLTRNGAANELLSSAAKSDRVVLAPIGGLIVTGQYTIANSR